MTPPHMGKGVNLGAALAPLAPVQHPFVRRLLAAEEAERVERARRAHHIAAYTQFVTAPGAAAVAAWQIDWPPPALRDPDDDAPGTRPPLRDQALGCAECVVYFAALDSRHARTGAAQLAPREHVAAWLAVRRAGGGAVLGDPGATLLVLPLCERHYHAFRRQRVEWLHNNYPHLYDKTRPVLLPPQPGQQEGEKQEETRP